MAAGCASGKTARSNEASSRAGQAEHGAGGHVHAGQARGVGQRCLAAGVGLGVAVGGKPQAELLIRKDSADQRKNGHQRRADAPVVAQPQPRAGRGRQHGQPGQQGRQAGQRRRHQHIEITARKETGIMAAIMRQTGVGFQRWRGQSVAYGLADSSGWPPLAASVRPAPGTARCGWTRAGRQTWT